jgi:hypothetical protein
VTRNLGKNRSGAAPVQPAEQKIFHSLEARGAIEAANYAGVRKAPVWNEDDGYATVQRCVVDCGRCKSVQPAIAVGALHFRSDHRRYCCDDGRFCGRWHRAADCGTVRQLLVSDSSATVLGYFFLDCAHQKNSNETATKGELNEMKSRIGTRDDSIAATCDQSAAGRREEKAKM